MRTRSIIGALLATTLTTLGLVATAAPASAATPTAIVSSIGGSWLRTYPVQQPGGPVATGEEIAFYIQVVSTDGSEDPFEGTVTLQRLLAGSTTWTTIATSTYPGYSGSAKAAANATYRVLYSGGSSSSTTWSPSSAAKSVKVQRKLSTTAMSGRKTGFRGSLHPAKRVKITVYKKVGHRFHRFKVLHSTARGRFTVALPAPRHGKTHWKVVFAGDRLYSASVVLGYTYRR